uniref:U1-type domain-containing protein n=1 Tax=Cyclopterus lumpus TaxID=8103 RepID=A0A8C2YWZ2_CYCLU
MKAVVKNLRTQDGKTSISRRDYRATQRKYGRSRSRSPPRDQFGRIIKKRRSTSADRGHKGSRYRRSRSRERPNRPTKSRTKSHSRSRSRSKSSSRSRSRSKERAVKKRRKTSREPEESHKRRRELSPPPRRGGIVDDELARKKRELEELNDMIAYKKSLVDIDPGQRTCIDYDHGRIAVPLTEYKPVRSILKKRPDGPDYLHSSQPYEGPYYEQPYSPYPDRRYIEHPVDPFASRPYTDRPYETRLFGEASYGGLPAASQRYTDRYDVYDEPYEDHNYDPAYADRPYKDPYRLVQRSQSPQPHDPLPYSQPSQVPSASTQPSLMNTAATSSSQPSLRPPPPTEPPHRSPSPTLENTTPRQAPPAVKQPLDRFLDMLNKKVDAEKKSEPVHVNDDLLPHERALQDGSGFSCIVGLAQEQPSSSLALEGKNTQLSPKRSSVERTSEEPKDNTEPYVKIQSLLRTIGLKLSTGDVSKLASRAQEKLYSPKSSSSERETLLSSTEERQRSRTGSVELDHIYSPSSTRSSSLEPLSRSKAAPSYLTDLRSRGREGSSSSDGGSRRSSAPPKSHKDIKEPVAGQSVAAPPPHKELPPQTPDPNLLLAHPRVPIPPYPPSQVHGMMPPNFPPPGYSQYGNYLPYMHQQWPPMYPPPNMAFKAPEPGAKGRWSIKVQLVFNPVVAAKTGRNLTEFLFVCCVQVLEEREKLKQERDVRMKKKEYLMKELERLRKQQGELLRKKRREKGGHKDPLLQEISHLQEEVMAQISNLRKEHEAAEKKRNEIEKIALILGLIPSDRPRRAAKLPEDQEDEPPEKKKCEAQRSPEGRQAASSSSIKVRTNSSPDEPPADAPTPPPEPFEYYDAGNHWCKNCNVTSGSMFDYFTHLHSKTHRKTLDPYDRPWASTPTKISKNLLSEEKLTKPAKGSEFLLPVRGFFCLLCKQFYGDAICAEEHVTTHAHNEKYKKQMYENPLYEQRRNLDRQAGLASEASGKKRKHEDEDKSNKDEKAKHKKEKRDKDKKKEESDAVQKEEKIKKEEDEEKAKLRKQSLETGKPPPPAVTATPSFGKFTWKKKESILAKEAEKVAAEFIKEDEAATKQNPVSSEDSFAKSMAVAKEIAHKLGGQNTTPPWVFNRANRGRIRPNLPAPAAVLRKTAMMGKPAPLNTFLSIRPQNTGPAPKEQPLFCDGLTRALNAQNALLENKPQPLIGAPGTSDEAMPPPPVSRPAPLKAKLEPLEANSAPPVCNPAPPGCNPAPPVCNPAPPVCNPAPPGCNPAPPGCNPAPPGCNPAPPGCNPAPPVRNPAPPVRNPAPPVRNPAPPVRNPAPPGCNPAPPGCNPAPPGCNPAPPGCNPAPPGCNPAPIEAKPAPSVAKLAQPTMVKIVSDVAAPGVPEDEQTHMVFVKPPPFMNIGDGPHKSDKLKSNLAAAKAQDLFNIFYNRVGQSGASSITKPATDNSPGGSSTSRSQLPTTQAPKPQPLLLTQSQPPSEVCKSLQPESQSPQTRPEPVIQIESVWSLQSSPTPPPEVVQSETQPRLNPPAQSEAQSAPQNQSWTPKSQSQTKPAERQPTPQTLSPANLAPQIHTDPQPDQDIQPLLHLETHPDMAPEHPPKPGPKTRGKATPTKRTPPAPRAVRQTRSQTRYQTRQQQSQSEPELASGDFDSAASDSKGLDSSDPGSGLLLEEATPSEQDLPMMEITPETLGLPTDMTSLDFDYDFNFE